MRKDNLQHRRRLFISHRVKQNNQTRFYNFTFYHSFILSAYTYEEHDLIMKLLMSGTLVFYKSERIDTKIIPD